MNLKRVIALLLSLIMVLALVSCGGPKDTSAKENALVEKDEQVETAPESDALGDELPAADVAEQGFNSYDKAISYSELFDLLGPIPKIEGDITIGFCAKAFENEFWRMEKEGAESAEKILQELGYNVKVDARAAQGESDEQGQLAVLNDMVNRKYDAIMAAPIADGNLLPGVENALKEGIPMCVVNDAFMPQIKNTVGAWHLEGAELAAEWVKDQIGGSGQVAIIQGLPKTEAARIRTEGFKAWIEEHAPEVEVVAVQNADWDRMKAKEAADIWMKQYPELKAIYANNDTMAMGALEAVKAAGRLGDCLVVGCDGTSEALSSIKEGELSATVDNYPFYMSQIGIEVVLRTLGGQDVPKVVYAPQAVIFSDNVDKTAEEIIGWNGFVFEE